MGGKEVQQKQKKVGIKVESKGGKSEFVLTSLVKTRMNK
jgi:uncharacterized protein YmfQ (DUF2313 family)